jgi:hypothetical protein
VANATRPFAVEVAGIGILASPSDPDLLFLHLNVAKTPPLLDLYARLKSSLDALGLRTYPFSPEEWVPHLTLASGHWSRRDLRELLRELDPEIPGCILPVAEMDVNHRALNGEWHQVAMFSSSIRLPIPRNIPSGRTDQAPQAVQYIDRLCCYPPYQHPPRSPATRAQIAPPLPANRIIQKNIDYVNMYFLQITSISHVESGLSV